MKQPKVPVPLPSISKEGFSKSYKDVSEKELIYQLEKLSKGAHMLSKQKSEFLMSIYDNQDELIAKAKLLDEIMGGNIASSLKALIPRNPTIIKRSSSNSGLATYIVKLFKPLHLLREFLIGQFDATENGCWRRETRRSSQERQERKSKIMMILDTSHELYLNLEKDSISRHITPTEYTIAKPVKLTNEQRDLHFSKDFIPSIEKYQFCVMCGHQTTILPPTNKYIDKYNNEQEKEFQRKLKLYEKHMKAVADGKTVTSSGTRRPY